MSSNSEINAQNALHSTGPRTEAGKLRSRLNALRHGLTSQIVVLPCEDVEAYKAMTSEFHRDLSPQGIIETKFVQTLADTQWRLDRCTAIEHNLFALAYHLGAESEEQNRAVQSLQDRLIPELCMPECDSTPAGDPVTTGLELAAAFQMNANNLRILGAHERHLQRYFQTTLKMLRETQGDRKKSDHEKMKNAAALHQAAKRKGVTYNPAADGFVFSNTDIEMFIDCEKRVKEAHSPGSGL